MLGQINHSLKRLSRAEKRVAEWVLAHPREVAEATVADVARAAGTSQPTVIRFCRSIGLRGFRDLALRLTEALSNLKKSGRLMISCATRAKEFIL